MPTLHIVAPARSLAIVDEGVRRLAERRAAALGFDAVRYGEHALIRDRFDSAPTALRSRDLRAAFAAAPGDAIFTAIGGFNSVDLLDRVDYEAFAACGAAFCGASDVTVLLNALYARTGRPVLHGPNFASLGMLKGIGYVMRNLRPLLDGTPRHRIEPPAAWSDDRWFEDQDRRTFHPADGFRVARRGVAAGPTVGGNLSSMCLIAGSRYAPPLAGAVLFVESVEKDARRFARRLAGLALRADLRRIAGLVIGRFRRDCEVDTDALAELIDRLPLPAGCPVVLDADFGHTTPQFTLPIGWTAHVRAEADAVIEFERP